MECEYIIPLLGFVEFFGHYALPAFVSPWYENGDLRQYLDANRNKVGIRTRLRLVSPFFTWGSECVLIRAGNRCTMLLVGFCTVR